MIGALSARASAASAARALQTRLASACVTTQVSSISTARSLSVRCVAPPTPLVCLHRGTGRHQIWQPRSFSSFSNVALLHRPVHAASPASCQPQYRMASTSSDDIEKQWQKALAGLSAEEREHMEAEAEGATDEEKADMLVQLNEMMEEERKEEAANAESSAAAVSSQEEARAAAAAEEPDDGRDLIYIGAMSKPLKILKKVSLGSCVIATVGLPALLLLFGTDSVPLSGQLAMVGTVVFAGVGSTGLLHWCTKGYIHKLHEKGDTLFAETMTLFAQQRITEFTVRDIRADDSWSPFCDFKAVTEEGGEQGLYVHAEQFQNKRMLRQFYMRPLTETEKKYDAFKAY